MSGLGHILEAEGITTIVVGLVPQHVKTIRPPRALLVPFEMGRPFGAPNRVDLQRAVLNAALALLDEKGPGPIVKRFDTDATVAVGDDPWVCPVAFPAPSSDTPVTDRLLEEVRLLMPWFDRGVKLRGHSAADVSGVAVEDSCRWLPKFLEDPTPNESPVAERSLGETFKLCVEDLKAFYLEAVTSQPGLGTAQEINNWFWDETAAGDLLWRLRAQLMQHSDEVVRLHASFTLVPEVQVRRRETSD